LNEPYVEHPFPPSLWCATAKAAVASPALDQNKDVDVVIVGAGFTGLSTALHLAEKKISVCVLESEQPGWGASGRNGGQVIPGLKYDLDELKARMGARAESVFDMASGAADTVFNLIEKYQIDCNPVRKGWIQTAHSSDILRTMENRVKQWESRGVHAELLDKAAVADRTGGVGFVGGWVDYRAGSVQPLSYTRGLLRVAQKLGASIHSYSPVRKIEKKGTRWLVSTLNGSVVTADRVLLATNGYTDDLWPQLRQTILAANSFLVATTPLSDDVSRSILKGGEVSSDSRRLLVYFRRDEAGRLVLGGRGTFNNPQSLAQWVPIERALSSLFPQLKNIKFQYRWSGRVAVTVDFLPHIHEPASGLHIVMGYNGRGIALATKMGALLADHISSNGKSPIPYPISQISPIPLHRFQKLYMSVGVAWYRLLDAVF